MGLMWLIKRDFINSGERQIVDRNKLCANPPAFRTIENTWEWNFSGESTITPRSTGPEDSVIGESFIVYVHIMSEDLRLKWVTEHFDAFIFNPQEADVSENLAMSFCADNTS